MFLNKKHKNKMEDGTKIQVLMIYYGHWGNEQNHLRKIIHGYNRLHQSIMEYTLSSLDNARENYQLIDHDEEASYFSEYIEKLYDDPSSSSLRECLEKFFEDEPIFDDELVSEMSFDDLAFFIDILLENCGGNPFKDKNVKISRDDIIGQKRMSVEYFCKTTEEANEILYDESFTEEMVLSVESIIAIL